MGKLRVGIIGTGGISNCHMSGYNALAAEGKVEVVAACDIDAEKLAVYCEKYNIPAQYIDCREMMKKEHLDLVSVCTWNAAHKDCTITALRGGADVICEKPMALNAAEAQEMYDTAKECGKLLQIGFVRRFGDDAAATKKLIADGIFGDVYYATATYLRMNGCPGGWFGDKKFSGGGPLIDLGVHVIDLSRYLAGCPKPVSVFGVTYNNLGPDRANSSKEWSVDDNGHPYTVEDLCSAHIVFDNGFTMLLQTSFNLNLPGDRGGEVQIFGTKAGAELSSGKVLAVREGRFDQFEMEGDHLFDFGKAFNNEIRGFYEASQGISPCKAPAEDGVALMKIIDAIYESAATGKSVDIK